MGAPKPAIFIGQKPLHGLLVGVKRRGSISAVISGAPFRSAPLKEGRFHQNTKNPTDPSAW